MKSRRNFLILLILFATLVIGIIAFVFSGKKTEEENLPEEVDYTTNILKNSSFEKGNLSFWTLEFQLVQKTYALIDDILKYEGNYSLNITSEIDTQALSVSQFIKPLQLDKKIIFNGRVRTEDAEAVFLRMRLFSSKDTLIVEAISDTLRGTNDWTFLTTWLRTLNQDASYLKVECCLVGKGRAWFDNLEVFPVDIQEKGFFPVRIK